MLVLTVEVGEKVRLWSDNDEWLATVQVNDVGGSHVRLGFHAPPRVNIWREKIDRHVPPTEEHMD